VQVAENALEARERFPDVARLLVFRIRFVGDLDVEVEAIPVLLAQKMTPDHPAVVLHEIDGDGRHFALLSQYAGGQVEQQFGDFARQFGRLLGAHFYVEDRHDRCSGI
jgi:hypothetical protein